MKAMKMPIVLVLGAFLAGVCWGCGPGPKPGALMTLEKMRSSAMGDPALQGSGMLDEAEKYYKMSVDAWQDSEEERAAEYALLGQIRVETAQVQTERRAAEERLRRSDERLLTANNKAAQHKKDMVGLEQSLVVLEAEYTRKKASNDAAAQQGSQNQAQLDEALMAAEAEMLKGQGIQASEHAKGTWAMAQNTLNMALQYKNSGQIEQAIQMASEARGAFGKAYAEALPVWEQAKHATSLEGRIEGLQKDAVKSFQIDAIAQPKGAIVVLPRLFKKKKASPLEERLFLLQMAVDLAQKYSEAKILIEGHTQSKGKESKNDALSEERAAAVRDYFVMQGVDPSRIRTLGAGENRARFDNDDKDERGKNDRVEIVLTIP